MNLEEHSTLKKSVSLLNHKMLEIIKSVENEELFTILTDLNQRIQDPFLFVIVGEVKAGKSSFINALLRTEQDICKVAPSPMTDTIQRIVYGDVHREEITNQYLKTIYYPEEILKKISVVDTPGTNTIVDHHQEITERFIPQADLIVFVFESKNPYRESAWQFFDYISDEWRKKIVFVLQQKDLMEAEDLSINMGGVRQHAISKGIQEPKIFAVSAKQEKDGDLEKSGFRQLHAYLNQNITGGQSPFLKLRSIADSILTISEKFEQSLQQRKLQWESDTRFREEIDESLQSNRSKTGKQINFLVENLIAAYDRITKKRYDELDRGLSFVSLIKKSFSSWMGGDQNPKEWLENQIESFEYELNHALKEKLQDGVMDIAENIQDMAVVVDAKLKSTTTILDNTDEIFHNIAERRASVLSELLKTFQDFLKDPQNFYDQDLTKSSKNLAPNLAAGSGIAVIGVILASLTNGAVFDITGGILTAFGLIFAGASIGYKRRKILNTFNQEIHKGRHRIQNEVSQKLNDYSDRIQFKILNNFTKLDEHLERESKEIKRLENSLIEVNHTGKSLQEEIDFKLSEINK